jgi:hypothetical protein
MSNIMTIRVVLDGGIFGKVTLDQEAENPIALDPPDNPLGKTLKNWYDDFWRTRSLSSDPFWVEDFANILIASYRFKRLETVKRDFGVKTSPDDLHPLF